MTLSSKLVRVASIIGATAAFAVVGAAPASAHVKVSADHAWRGGVAMLTFTVPNESSTGSTTTELTVALPNVTSAHTEMMPGWAARLDEDVSAGVFHSVTWSVAPPNGGIPPEQFALFRVEVTLPDSDTASFPATQRYADGTVVHWDQLPPPGGAEPGHPAPTLALTTASPGRTHAPAADPAARWLAGAALAVGVVGVGLAATGRRRRAM